MGYVLTFVAIVIVGIIDLHLSNSEIVLLESNQSRNEIIIQKNDDKTLLNKTNTFVTINKFEKGIAKAKEISKEEIFKRYGDIVHKKVITPTSLVFYFHEGSTNLTKDSEKKLKELIFQIKRHYPTDVTVIGHSDTKGSDELNIKISLERAVIIRDWIIKQNLQINNLKVESYGEKDLAVITKDNVSEAKNRRVEVQIR